MCRHTFRLCLSILFAVGGIWFCLFPFLTALYFILFDTGLQGDGPSRYAIRLHQ
ncbi:MAG: hypothetical protein O3A87_04630 [Verrucomicrobia bacterium]|nr:hypothetical protein [Verrucomicrobiota bacterium]MDA1005753.1 hypothetical protein [Verrucomicrobiota bacterium]